MCGPGHNEVVEIAETIKTLILEIVSGNGACHIQEIHLQVTGPRPEVPQHTVRARLSEMSRSENLEQRLKAFGNGFYGLYDENKSLRSVVSYPDRGPWGDASYRGNCSGYLVKDLNGQFFFRGDIRHCGTDNIFFNARNIKSMMEANGQTMGHMNYNDPPTFSSKWDWNGKEKERKQICQDDLYKFVGDEIVVADLIGAAPIGHIYKDDPSVSEGAPEPVAQKDLGIDAPATW